MKIDEVRLLYDYNYWANRRILAAAAGTTPEQQRARQANGSDSLHDTLVHTLGAEMIWRRRLEQAGPRGADESEPATLAELAQAWVEDEALMRAYLARLTDDELNRVLHFQTSKGEPRQGVLWYYLVHVVNHGTQHRSEAASTLTGYGRSPGNLDFTVFLQERG